MRKFLAVTAIVLALPLFAGTAHAQMMGGYTVADDGHTLREEAEGKTAVSSLAAGTTTCAALADDDFERVGEYYMGLMVGDAHVSMNAMMARQLGESGEEQMHVIMGERFSGCDPTAGNDSPYWSGSWMPMMGMMNGIAGGTWSGTMMSRFGTTGWSFVSVVTTLLFWAVGIVALIVLVRSLLQPRDNKNNGSKTK